jgi:hypothetical protein
MLGVLSSIDNSPQRIGMRFLGMSGDEADRGIPSWSLAVAALALGVTAGVMLGPKLQMARNSLNRLTGRSSGTASSNRKVFGRYG